jgi:hypothetical protein
MHWLDPDYLPEISGTVKQFLINTRCDIDGLIFKVGTEMHFQTHMSAQTGNLVTVGQKVKVRGIGPHTSDEVAGVSIQVGTAERIVDDGPPKYKPGKPEAKHGSKLDSEPGEANSTVQRILRGPNGELRAVLLETGEAIRFVKHEASRLASLNKAGAKFAARGDTLTTKFGTVVDADWIGSSEKTLCKIGPKGPRHESRSEHAH